jgi:hypothetical protein
MTKKKTERKPLAPPAKKRKPPADRWLRFSDDEVLMLNAMINGTGWPDVQKLGLSSFQLDPLREQVREQALMRKLKRKIKGAT